MAVPKRHKTSSRRNQRRMHLYLEAPTVTLCPKCKKPVKPHNVCKNCGFYAGREVINVLGKLSKKERKSREKDIKEVAKEEKPLTMENLSQK